MKQKIVWKPDEIEHVTQRARSFGAPERGDSPEIWVKMQEGLPANRRRPFDPSTMALINQARRSQGRPKKHEELPKLVMVEPAVEAPQAQQEEAVATPAAAQSIAHSLVDSVTETILEVANRVLYDSKLRQALRDLIKETVAPETDEQVETGVLWRPKLAGKEARKRVVIAAGGIFASNAKEVLRPLTRFYDLRYWDSRKEHPARLRNILEQADIAVVVTNSISHGGAEACRSWNRAGKGKLINFTQNVASLVEKLPGLIGDEIQIVAKEGTQ